MPPTAMIERGDQHETEQRQDRGGLGQIPERHQRCGMRCDDAGSFERDDAQKQPDPGRDRELEIVRDRINDVLADRQDRDQQKQHAGAEHGREPLLPGIFVGDHDGEGEERIEPHAGRERNRIIGVKPHHQRARRRGEAGRDEYRALVHTGIAENLRIDEDDIDHRQKGGQAGDEFSA